MLEHERASDVLKWYSLMKLIEKKYGIVKVLAPAVGFLVLVRPEYVRLISPECSDEASFEFAEQIVRLELAKRALSDLSHIAIQREEFETIMETNSDEQRTLIEENILPFDRFKRCGFDSSEKSFIDYLARSNARGSVRHASSSHRQLALPEDGSPKDSYTVAMDERTLQAYVFSQSQRNLKCAFNCIQNLVKGRISLSYRNIQRLGELFGVDSDLEWQSFLKIMTRDGVTPRDDKSLSADLIIEAMSQAKDHHLMMAGLGRSASQIWEENKRLEAEKVAEDNRRKDELRKLEVERRKVEERRKAEREIEEKLRREEADKARKLIEDGIKAEQERIYREEIQKKLEEERIIAKRREAEEQEKHRRVKLREKFIEE
jgi:hypothetical protein